MTVFILLKQQELNCFIWYIDLIYITETQPNYRRTHGGSTVRSSLLKCVQKFQEHGTVEIRERSGRPLKTSTDVQSVFWYINRPWEALWAQLKQVEVFQRAQTTEIFETEFLRFCIDFKLFRSWKSVIRKQGVSLLHYMCKISIWNLFSTKSLSLMTVSRMSFQNWRTSEQT